MTSLAIFDYGAGNIFSLRNSLEKTGATVNVIQEIKDAQGYSGLLLPGVGNFDPAIKSINVSEFAEHTRDMPVLGICLGMEMFFEASQEGKEKGLGVVDGSVQILPDTIKVPHMGWNSIEIKSTGRILQGIKDGSWVYFVHSYHASPASSGIITAVSDYGVKIPAVIEHRNYIGTQFHPEKSGAVGQAMMENFVGECKR